MPTLPLRGIADVSIDFQKAVEQVDLGQFRRNVGKVLKTAHDEGIVGVVRLVFDRSRWNENDRHAVVWDTVGMYKTRSMFSALICARVQEDVFMDGSDGGVMHRVLPSAGSIPEKSAAVYGYSEATRIKGGPMTKQVVSRLCWNAMSLCQPDCLLRPHPLMDPHTHPFLSTD